MALIFFSLRFYLVFVSQFMAMTPYIEFADTSKTEGSGCTTTSFGDSDFCRSRLFCSENRAARIQRVFGVYVGI